MSSAAGGVRLDLLPHLRQARDHIDRYYQRDLTIDQLAAVGGFSKYHFARCFQAAYGETPIRYLTRRRIERARDLLRCANRGGPHVPGCYLFMRGELDPRGTAGGARQPEQPGRSAATSQRSSVTT